MDVASLLRGGDTRAYIHYVIFCIVYCTPTAILALLISTTKLSERVKQILAFPVLLAAFLIPINYTCQQRVIDVAAAAVCYNTVLRFLELFYIGPLVMGRPVYADMNYLHDELWYCLREVPRKTSKSKSDPKNTKKSDEKSETKDPAKESATPVKDKKFYHIILYMGFHIMICDILGSYFSTFTATDVTKLQNDQPFTFVIFLILAIILMTSAFNLVGYGLQLFYCLYYQAGSYASKEFRSLMKSPILASSLDDLWSVRWHQLFHTTWVAFGFRPTWVLAQRVLAKHLKNPKPVAYFLSVLGVFVASSLMHEYMIYSNVGWEVYRRFFIGQQMFFFCFHGAGTVVELLVRKLAKRYVPEKYQSSFVVGIISRIWVVFYACYTFPYFIDGFAYWGIWHSNPFIYTRPIVHRFLQTAPGLRQLCGSLLP